MCHGDSPSASFLNNDCDDYFLRTFADALAELLAVFPSGEELITVNVLVRAPDAVGVTTTVTVALAPLASVPRSHLMVLVPTQLPTLALTETKVAPAGRVSSTVVRGAAAGPKFATTAANVTGEPMGTELGFADALSDKSLGDAGGPS